MRRTLAFLILLFAAGPVFGQEVVRLDTDSTPDESLADRYDRAVDAADAADREAWIGFSVTRMMRENSVMGRFVGDWRSSATIGELLDLSPGKAQSSVEEAARNALDNIERQEAGRPERKIEKKIAILIRRETDARIRDVAYSNMTMAIDLGDRPLYWIGHADDTQAFDLIDGLYVDHRSDGTDVGEDLISAMGLIDTPEVHAWLFGIVESGRPANERERAVFWLGESDNPRSAQRLHELADEDRSEDVREQAVFALYRMQSDAALGHLIDLARHAEHEGTVEKARFWLANRAGDRLVDGMGGAEPSDIEKQAVFALSRLDDDAAIEELAVVARGHSNPHIRKQALFWLGQRDDDESLSIIMEILEGGR